MTSQPIFRRGSFKPTGNVNQIGYWPCGRSIPKARQGFVLRLIPAPGVLEHGDRFGRLVLALERQVVITLGIERRIQVDQVDRLRRNGKRITQDIQAIFRIQGSIDFLSAVGCRLSAVLSSV